MVKPPCSGVGEVSFVRGGDDKNYPHQVPTVLSRSLISLECFTSKHTVYLYVFLFEELHGLGLHVSFSSLQNFPSIRNLG